MDSIETLTPQLSTRLRVLEQQIEHGMRGFLDVGRALVEIRDAHLYRQGYDTFAAYLRGRWDISRARGYQLLEAAEVMELMSKNLDNGIRLPANDAQARALAPLKAQPVKLATVWKRCAERPHITAAVVEAEVADATRKPPGPSQENAERAERRDIPPVDDLLDPTEAQATGYRRIAALVEEGVAADPEEFCERVRRIIAEQTEAGA